MSRLLSASASEDRPYSPQEMSLILKNQNSHHRDVFLFPSFVDTKRENDRIDDNAF